MDDEHKEIMRELKMIQNFLNKILQSLDSIDLSLKEQGEAKR